MTPEAVREQLVAAAALHKQGRLAEALTLYRVILDADPGNMDASTFMASALRSMGRAEEAVALYDEIAATEPARADFWYNRGNALNDFGRHEEAVASYRRALALEPDNAAVLANLGIAQAKLGRPDEAVESYRRALASEPDHKIALHNLGNLLADRGENREAARLLRRTVRNWPDLAEGHYNLALLLLRLGDFTTGFREYEWRWETQGFFTKPAYRGIPAWTGEPIAGKRLIVHSEQGLGDTLQFAKPLGMLASLGGDVVFHVPEKLERLLKTLPYPITVTGAHGASDADYQVPLMSLPYRLRMTLGSVPSAPSFLSADAERAQDWSGRLKLESRQPAIGFVWQGNPNSPAERGRSLPSPELIAPFAALEGARLIALQKLGRDDLEPSGTASGWRVPGLSFMMEHPGPEMDDGPDAFLDTAAIMSGLDLVVSVCTAPLHLAGALGRPSVAILKTVPDWRWLTERTDTLWYPAMRLARQKPGETFEPAIGRALALVREMLCR